MSLVHLSSEFPFKQQHPDLVYLDSAATTQKPKVVLDALQQAYAASYANVHRGAHQWSRATTEAFETARQKLAQFVHVPDARHIIFTSGATASINMVAHGLTHAIHADDVILVDQAAHHANWVPWQELAVRTGAQLKVIPITKDGFIDTTAYHALLKCQPKIVALTHVSNVLGTCNPVAELTLAAQAAGAKVLIDGAQAVAHFEVDVTDIGCDYYVFSSHKMYGPTGVGVLTGTFESLDLLHPMLTGGEMVQQVALDATTYQGLPHRLEAGTPAIAEVIGFGAVVDWLSNLPRKDFFAQEQQLLQEMRQQMQSIEGITLYGDAAYPVGVIAFNIEPHHHHDVSQLLDQHGILMRDGHHCAMPLLKSIGLSGCCRLSVGLYTEQADLDKALSAIKEVKEFLDAI